jgi:His-Xaa-Ser system protein HxsD
MSETANEVRFSSRAYDLEIIKKAAYRFSDSCAFEFSFDGDDIICHLLPTTNMLPDATLALQNAFRNEVLDQDLRRIIGEETTSVRNAVLGYAFSRTGLQSSE